MNRFAAALAVLTAVGCEGTPLRRPAVPPEPSGAHIESLGPDDIANAPPPPPIAEREPMAPDDREAHEDDDVERVIERAPATDTEYDSDEIVQVRRFVYSVRFYVPYSLGDARRSGLAIPAAELVIDVSDQRLRARFEGPGWPVDARSEVRIRGDSPGTYVFDRRSGRSFAPGVMAEWFEGGPRNRLGPPLVVRRDPLHDGSDVPGALICAFLSEWAGEPREHAMHRCDRGAPIGFRLGFWRADRTADVPVELPRRLLRADEVAPPPAATSGQRAFLEPEALARVPTMEHPPRDQAVPVQATTTQGLEFVNESEARVIATVEGVALGWIDSGSRVSFAGIRPGFYRVAAIRPLGAVVIRPRLVRIPGRTVLRPPRHAVQDSIAP